MKLILTLLLTLVVSGAKNDSAFIIKAGKEVDKLKIGDTVQSAVDKFGKYSKFNRGIACGDSESLFFNRFFFTNHYIVVHSTTIEGSEVNKELTKSEIDAIDVLFPANGTTDRGINLRTDKLKTVIKVYGKPERKEDWKFTIELHYHSKGISFTCDNITGSIEKIAIYKTSK